jgi:type IV secretory pathway VirB2 component (pilin)
MKKILTFIFLTIPYFTLAVGYQPLVSDSPLKSAASGGNLEQFLKQIYDWGVMVAVALAILFIIFGGIEYMTTDSVFKKDQGKKRVTAAVAGLLLVFSSWLVLNQINPQIFNNSLNLGTLNTKGLNTAPIDFGGTVIDGGGIPTNTPDTNTPGGESSPVIGDEAAIRSTLSQNGISVNKNPCTYVGQRGCTDTFGLKKSTMDTLLTMKNNSGKRRLKGY